MSIPLSLLTRRGPHAPRWWLVPELRVPRAGAPTEEWDGRRLALTAWMLAVSDKPPPVAVTVAEAASEGLEIPTFLRR